MRFKSTLLEMSPDNFCPLISINIYLFPRPFNRKKLPILLGAIDACGIIRVRAPSKAGAVLEGSKDFAKAFMLRHNIPTARYQTFDGEHLEEGLKFLETLEAPYVLKADGLCAGKGVLILPTLDEAKKELKEMLGGMFGNASSRVVTPSMATPTTSGRTPPTTT